MHPIEAAYEFGYSVPMVHRAGLYHWQFALGMDPFNYYDGSDDHVKQALERLSNSFSRLIEHIDRDKARRIDAKIRDVEKVSKDLLKSFDRDGKWKGSDYGVGRFPGISACEGLALAVDGALEGSPRLMTWQRIGQAVGSCNLATVANEGPEIPVDLEPLRVAAMALSPETRQSIPLLNRCASLTVTRFERNAAPELERLLGGNLTVRPAPPTKVISQLIRLDVMFKEAICLLTARQASRIQLHCVDTNHHQAVLDGVPFEVSHANYIILKALMNAASDYVTIDEIIATDPASLESVRLDREIKKLPSQILDLIQSRPGHGGGYRIAGHRPE